MALQEIFQYDPTGDYLRPALKGLRLFGDNYLPIESTISNEGTLILRSKVLGLDLRLTNEGLRFYAPESGEKLLTHQEAEKARQEAIMRIAELEAELNALKRKS